MDSIIADGEILKISEYVPYGYENSVVLTQKIWFGFGGIPLFTENITSVKQQLAILNRPVPPLFNNENELFRIIKRLLNRMRYFRSGIITIHIFAGKVETHFLIKAVAFDDFVFPISKKGLQINHSELVKFSKNPFSKYGFFNVPLWNIAEVPLVNTSLTNTIFFNENNSVTECIGANIFAVKGRELFTPAVDTGCYIDTIRSFILEAGAGCSLKIIENSRLTKEELIQMNEIFIASEEKGIEWVMGIQNRRFVHQISDEVQLKLNEILKAKVV
jgi:branched-chain amino acid aminotransferase